MWRNKFKIFFLTLSLIFGLYEQASAVNCFWVGGTATWDGSNFTSWATTTGGAGVGCPSASNVPTNADVAIFDGSSGGGTVTVNATTNISSLTTSAFTGTLDFSANNNNINIGTVTAGATGWADAGTGTHTVNMGNGTWTIDATTAVINFGGANMTLAANSSTLSAVARAVSRTFIGNGKTFNNVTFNGATPTQFTTTGANTYSTLTITNQSVVTFGSNNTISTLTITNSASLPVSLKSGNLGIARTLTLTNSLAASYLALQDITFSGGTNSASNSFDFGNNSGIIITGPTGGGGGSGKIIGG